jgi:hypothetical protein
MLTILVRVKILTDASASVASVWIRPWCMSCLSDDFDVYRRPLSNNIRLSPNITPTDVIVINAMISYLLNYVSKTVLEISMLIQYI